MKNARLWKRILNEGFLSTFNNAEFYEQAIRLIVKAPIIVDTRTIAEVPAPPMSCGVSLPFNPVWIEGIICDDGFGCLVCGTDDGFLHFSCFRELDRVTYMGRSRLKAVNSIELECYTKRHIELNGQKVLMDNVEHITRLACDTLFFLSCRNVDLKPHDNDPKQVRRAVKRYGGTSDSYRYHTLIVRPAGSKPGTPGEEVGIMPRHVCRGHISRYGPEFNKGLLFGKYAGQFFIPPHMRGNKKNGIVEKDYEVRA